MQKFVLIIVIMISLQGCSNGKITSIREAEVSPQPPQATSEVTIIEGKFEPNSIILGRGQLVKIHNTDSKRYTIISNPHPTHDQMPELYEIIYRNETKTIEFDKQGAFGVHLEENPSVDLKIVVE
jgi:plastocyanin